MVDAVVRDLAADRLVTLRIGARDDAAVGEVVSIVVEGRRRAVAIHSPRSIEHLFAGCASWCVEEHPDWEGSLRRVAFEVARSKPRDRWEQSSRNTVASGLRPFVRDEFRGVSLEGTPPERLAVGLTVLSAWMAADWVTYWCALARHRGGPITTAQAVVTDSTTMVVLGGAEGRSMLLRSAGAPVPRRSSSPTATAQPSSPVLRAQLPVAGRRGVDGAAAAARIGQVARDAGVAEEDAHAAGVIAGVLVKRYLAASGQDGLLRMRLSDPVPRTVAAIGTENDTAAVADFFETDANLVAKLERIRSAYSESPRPHPAIPG